MGTGIRVGHRQHVWFRSQSLEKFRDLFLLATRNGGEKPKRMPDGISKSRGCLAFSLRRCMRRRVMNGLGQRYN